MKYAFAHRPLVWKAGETARLNSGVFFGPVGESNFVHAKIRWAAELGHERGTQTPEGNWHNISVSGGKCCQAAFDVG